MTPKKHYADAAYQKERRAKIKAGEITPVRHPKRHGLVDTLRSGGVWLEEFSNRADASAFQRIAGSCTMEGNYKVTTLTYVCVDPHTYQVVFIVKAQRASDT